MDIRRLRVATMAGLAFRRIGTVTPAHPDFHSGEAGATELVRVPYSRETN